MNIAPGQRYTTALKVPHRIDAVVVGLHDDYVAVDADHRCQPYCFLLRDHAATLTLSGRRVFSYRDFSKDFVFVADGAIALGCAP